MILIYYENRHTSQLRLPEKGEYGVGMEYRAKAKRPPLSQRYAVYLILYPVN